MFRKFIVCATALLLTSFQPVDAATTTFTFKGVLTDIRQGGAGISFGTTFEATYTHNDAPQTGRLIESNRWLYSGGSFQVLAGKTRFVGPSSSELQIFNDWTSIVGGYDNDDGFFVSSSVLAPDFANRYLIQFDLWEKNGMALTSLNMPSFQQVQQLGNEGRVWIRKFENGLETGLAAGGFSQISAVSAIPEPTASTLFFLVLVVVALKRSTRSTFGASAA